MKSTFNSFAVIAFVIILALVVAAWSAPQIKLSNTAPQAGADWKAVEQALGKAGSMQPGDVYKVSLPRSDLKVTVGGVELFRLVNDRFRYSAGDGDRPGN